MLVLLQNIDPLPKAGRQKRAEPGDDLSLAIRKGLQKYDTWTRPAAANQWIKERQALGELDPNIKPLNRKQVINIAEHKEHCAADPDEKRRLKRIRLLNKTGLDQDDKAARLAYCDEIDEYFNRCTIVIFTDERQYEFGGSSNLHATRPEGTSSF